MKKKSFASLSAEDLLKNLEDLCRERFSLRMQRSVGDFNKVHLLKQNRRDIARVKTILNSKK